MKIPIEISEEAIKEINSIYQTKGISAEMGLRIGVKGSGCSGTSFFLGFDTPSFNDQIFDFSMTKILIEKKHFLYLVGMKLDFMNNNSQRGFTFVSIK